MPRSKPIPPQILQMVEQGDLPSLRHLERLISPGNVTEEILATIFKCLTSHPVPVASDWVNELVLKTRVGSRPSACLCVFWKIFDLISRQGGTSKLEPTLLKHLLESGDLVLGWTRVCLQSGLPCVPDDMLLEGYSPRANRYLTVAHHLLMLLKLDEDYRAVMLSSTAFINLFLELWLVEDRRDRSGKLIWRMVNSKDFFGCSIIDLADTILSDSTSQEFILKRCVTAQQCDLFSRALMDRVTRGWEGDKVPLVGWTRSLDRLASITSVLCQASRRFRRILTRNGHLSQLCTELWGCSEDILGDFEMNFLVRPLLSSLTNLMHLALLDKANPSSFRHNWKHIVSGDFIEALFGATLMTCTREDDKEHDEKLDPRIRVIITTLERCVSQPWFFAYANPRPLSLELEKLVKFPDALQAWTFLLDRLSKGAEAYKALQTRPKFSLCDSFACTLSGRVVGDSSKQCSTCRSVLYCSQECQRADWWERHHRECSRIQDDHIGKEVPVGLYFHQARAFHAALLENTEDPYPLGALPAPADDAYVSCFGPRREALLAASQKLPPGWRLEQRVIPFIGCVHGTVRLTALLKPTDSGFRAVYCVEEYS